MIEEEDDSFLKKFMDDLEKNPPPPIDHKPADKDFFIGFLLGELMWTQRRQGMPTLSTSMCTSCNVKMVTDQDTEESKRLCDIGLEEYRENQKLFPPYGHVPNDFPKPKWDEYRTFNRMLERKYLPMVWRWYIPDGYVVDWNMNTRQGLISSLWNNDGTPYNTETFKYVVDPEPRYRHDYIEFYLDEEVK